MIAKVGPKGQIVIPKELRDELAIRPGSTVSLRRGSEGVVELRKAWDDPVVDGPAYIQGLIRPEHRGTSGTDELLALRREDREIEERQYERWLRGSSSSTPTR